MARGNRTTQEDQFLKKSLPSKKLLNETRQFSSIIFNLLPYFYEKVGRPKCRNFLERYFLLPSLFSLMVISPAQRLPWSRPGRAGPSRWLKVVKEMQKSC